MGHNRGGLDGHHGDCDRDTDCYGNRHSDRNRIGYADSDGDIDRDDDINADRNPYSYADGDRHADCDGHCYCDAQLDADGHDNLRSGEQSKLDQDLHNDE